MPSDHPRHVLDLDEAAAFLELPRPAVEALVGSGYLVPARTGRAGPEFPLSDLKAFMARNADNGVGGDLLAEAVTPPGASPRGPRGTPPGSPPGAPPRSSPGAPPGDPPARPSTRRSRDTDPHDSLLDPQELLDALDQRTADMARRVFEIFARVFPEAEGWTLQQQAAFVEQARSRFEAIIAVTEQGADVDAALFDDLRLIGASAARGGSPLPQLLVILRISRDLVVQTAIEVAEGGRRQGGLALSLLLTRILPAMDRLTDALAQGYWDAMLAREDEAQARYRLVVERASDGVYEVDLDGRITYANPAFALVVGRRRSSLQHLELLDVIRPLDPDCDIEDLLSESPNPPVIRLTMARADGVRRMLSIQPSARRQGGEVVGFQGVVRDDTVTENLEADRSEFAALLRSDLRAPLAAIVGLAATLESHSRELSARQAASTARAIRAQVERVSRMADDLSDIGQVQAGTLRCYPRVVELPPVVDAALASVEPAGGTPAGGPIEVDVATDVTVLADPRRLEQVIANLVDNAVAHGAAPVLLTATPRDDEVEIAVVDHGRGVPAGLVPALFAGRQTPTRQQRERARGRGLGLALVRGLAEAMGGRVWYERIDGCTRFVLAVPAAARVT